MTSQSSQETTTEELARITPTESLPAVFVSQAGAYATVIQGNTTIAVRSVSAYPPIQGEPVRLERRGGEVLLLGPSVPRSALGRVTATGTPRITVEYPSGSGVTQQMPYNPLYSPTVNDIVVINWESGGAVICKLTAVPNVITPDVPAPPSPSIFHPEPFTAIDSGSFNTSRRNNNVYASDSFTSGWFYGSTVNDTIPDTALIISARIYLPAIQIGGAMPNLGYHSNATAPSGSLTVSGAAALSARSGWVPIPTSLIDVLKASNSGLGFNHGGYNIYKAVATDGLSGALDITYQV